MPTLILSPRHTENSQLLWRTAIELGWDVERFHTFRIPPEFTCDDPVIYGEPLFNDVIASHLGVGLIEPDEDFLIQIGSKYTNREIRYINASEARRISCRSFFKPPNRKTFKAAVYETGFDLPSLNDDEKVLVSDVVDFRSEFRFFVLNRKVLTWSSYIYKREVDKEGRYDSDFYPTRNLVEKLLSDKYVDLPYAFVLDAGYIEGIGPTILEANEAQASGLYACNPYHALTVIKACVTN